MKKEEKEGHLDLLRLDAFRAGEGSVEERHHIDACDICRTELERMERDVLEAQGAMPSSPDLPRQVRRKILEAVMREAAPRRSRLHWPIYALPLAAAAAAILAIMVLLPGGKKGDPEPGNDPAVSEAPVERPTLDVNGDGFLDGGDIDELARIVDGWTGPADRWDLNGDGRTDGGDVDFLSREIGTESDNFEDTAGC